MSANLAAGGSEKKSYVLVTGGAGFIGSHLVERLLQEGLGVFIIDDLSTGTLDNLRAVRNHPSLTIRQARISACADLAQVVADAESIYHLAAAVGVELILKSPVQAIQTNLRETEVLLEAAALRRTPFLLASTSEVYGKSQKSVFSEDDDLLIGPPHQSRWSYACSKLMDEFLALACTRERGLPVVIARLFNTVGPRQTGRFGMVLPRFIEAAKAGLPLKVYGDGGQSRCFCYVRDTVEALVRLQNSVVARGQIFNVGGTEEITIRSLAAAVIQTLGSGSKIEMVPYAEAYEPGFEDMRRRRPSVEKLFRTVGFRPETDLATLIQQTANPLAIDKITVGSVPVGDEG
jgi:UDP-glucose 4-epimerase